MRYYNPKVFTPKDEFTSQIIKLDENESLHRLFMAKGIYPSRADAIKLGDEGRVCWKEGDETYSAWLVKASSYKAMENGKVYVDPGMNWCKYICTDKDVLIGYLRRLRHIDIKDDDEIQYNEKYGFYSINVHFDGRWR